MKVDKRKFKSSNRNSEFYSVRHGIMVAPMTQSVTDDCDVSLSVGELIAVRLVVLLTLKECKIYGQFIFIFKLTLIVFGSSPNSTVLKFADRV